MVVGLFRVLGKLLISFKGRWRLGCWRGRRLGSLINVVIGCWIKLKIRLSLILLFEKEKVICFLCLDITDKSS